MSSLGQSYWHSQVIVVPGNQSVYYQDSLYIEYASTIDLNECVQMKGCVYVIETSEKKEGF